MTLLTKQLRERGVQVWLDGGEVRCRAPKGTLGPEVKGWLRDHKTAIARELGLVEPEGSPEALRLGLVAKWSREFGYISIHDPLLGEWWDVQTKEAPDWAVREARKRREIYKAGNKRAYELTSREMEDIWEAEREPEGIVEDLPVEGL